jgi:hypothetical protein
MNVGVSVQSVWSTQHVRRPIFTKLTTDQQTPIVLSAMKLVQIGEKRRKSKIFTPLDEVTFQVRVLLFRNTPVALCA